MNLVLRHPDAFLFELRAVCDEAFAAPPSTGNPIAALLAGTMTRDEALAFFSSRWEQVLLRNEVITARLIEHCPDIHGRADIVRRCQHPGSCRPRRPRRLRRRRRPRTKSTRRLRSPGVRAVTG